MTNIYELNITNINCDNISIDTHTHTEKINELNALYNKFYDRFIEISNLKRCSKLAIDNNQNVCVQIWTPWRFLVRKITKQSTLLSLITIQHNLKEFIEFNKNIIELDNKLLDSFVTLISSNYNLIKAIIPNIKYLRDRYNLLGDNYKNHSIYLELIYNELTKLEKDLFIRIKIL
jgi:hypothetical protein